MDRIPRLIEQLRSPNKNKRYEACEELRVSANVPDEVLKALEIATHDPDQAVAEAASSALTFHTRVDLINYGHMEVTTSDSTALVDTQRLAPDRISRLIKQLGSAKKIERYEACEELQVSTSVPDEVLKALEKLTHDPERIIAEAAKKALTFNTQVDLANNRHTEPAKSDSPAIFVKEDKKSLFELLYSFEGRIPRSTFWYYILTYLGLSLIAATIDSAIRANNNNSSLGLFSLGLYLLGIFPGLAGGAKRCHDRDHSGWFLFISLIPFIGAIWLFIDLGLSRGTVGPNQYGPDPILS